MYNHVLGQASALLCAIAWAIAIILFKICGNTMHPIALNLFKNTVGLILLVLTLLITGEHFDTFLTFSVKDILILAVSGFIGIFIADTIFFHSLNLLGVSLSSIVDCTYSPFVILFSFLILSEKISRLDYLGALLILSGIIILKNHHIPSNRTKNQILMGIVWGITSMALMAFSIVIAKPALNNFSIIWASLIRTLSAVLGMLFFFIILPKYKNNLAVFKPSAIWKISIPASIIGAYISIILWIASLKYTYVSVASILNQTSAIFAFVLATIFLQEHFTKRKFASLILSICGVIIIILL
jgi:drug/metabolite transporter (DMT)-like permease